MGSRSGPVRQLLRDQPDLTSAQIAYRLKWGLRTVQRVLYCLHQTGEIERRTWWWDRFSYTWVYRLATRSVVSSARGEGAATFGRDDRQAPFCAQDRRGGRS
jgi:transcription initiation factor IIE alpha subunit